MYTFNPHERWCVLSDLQAISLLDDCQNNIIIDLTYIYYNLVLIIYKFVAVLLLHCFRERRGELLGKWRAKGGVFLIGYSSFRNLSLGKYMKDRHSFKEVCSALQVTQFFLSLAKYRLWFFKRPRWI